MAEDAGGEELDEDLEVLHITACKEKKGQLEAERERREECIERLQVKLKALNSELAARNEEVMTLRQQNDALVLAGERESRSAPGHEADGDESPTAAWEQKILRFMEEQLKERAQRRSARNEFGIRQFDEMELMVQKHQEEQKREMSYIDTVLITWQKAPSAEQTYNLTYRVDRNMTSKKLREDACFYWGISEVEYVLNTVTTNSKVQDDVTIQNCFRQNEDAHLMLVHKTPTLQRPSEEELKAIRPKTGVKARKQPKSSANADDKPAAAAQSADFAKQLDVVPGFKDFMLQHDQKVRGHLERLKLQSICIFFFLAVATVVSIFEIRPPNLEFICHHGVMSAVAAPRTASATASHIPGFEDIASHAQLWAWLRGTVPAELLEGRSRLRGDNYLPGWLELRVQQVAEASAEACGRGGLPLPGARCVAERYSSETADRADLAALRAAWVNRSGADGRSSAEPWRFTESRDRSRLHRVVGGSGVFSSFDASGYAVQYDLQSNLTATRAAYEQDMLLFQRLGWIGRRTRSLQLTFAAFNGNYDIWLAASFVVELSAAGLAFPRARVSAYRPKFTDWHWYVYLIIDAVRLGLMVYVCTLHLYYEFQAESKKRPGKRFYQLLVNWRILTDVTLGCLFVYVFAVRYFYLGALGKDTTLVAQELGAGFRDVQFEADLYRSHTVADATVLALALCRFLSCCRVNRHIFIIWEALRTSARSYGAFVLVFLPMFLGFAMLSHALWGAETMENKTFWDSFTSTLMILSGDMSVIAVNANGRPITVVFLICFYFFVTLLFVNSWTAVLVHTYQQVRVAAGFDPKSYAWGEDEWLRWTLWSPLARAWRWLRPRRRGLDEA